MEPAEIQNLEARTIAIVDWLNLEKVPTAASVDPDNKMVLSEAFRKIDGIWLDPIRKEVLEQAKKSLKTTEVPLLESQYVGGTHSPQRPKLVVQGKLVSSFRPEIRSGGHTIPLFKEQVYATAQFLANLGFEPKPKGGETFVLGDQERVKIYPTKDPMIKVKIERDGTSEISPVTKIKLVINSRPQ